MQFEFISPIDDCTASIELKKILGDYSWIDDTFDNVVVKWRLELDARKDGLHGKIPSLQQITGTHYLEVFPKEDDDPTSYEASFTHFVNDKYNDQLRYHLNGKELIFDVEFSLEYKSDQLFPNSIELDFKILKCYIS